MPHNNLDAIAGKLSNMLRCVSGFEIEINNVDMFHFGVVYLSVKKSPILCELQENIIKVVSPLKEDCICADYLKPNRQYTPKQGEMLRLHGNPFVLSEFNPHITVGFLRNAPPDISAQFDHIIPKTKFSVDTLHLRWQKNLPNQPIQNFRDYSLS